MDDVKIDRSEASRLKALADLQILDTAAEKIYDSITQLATEFCDIPISLIVFIDKDRQWFKSTYGIPVELKDVRETPREIAFCEKTIQQNDLLEIEDLTQDERFLANPFVTKFPNIRFYAGVPLATEDGHNVGTMCLLDQKPRKLNDEQKRVLKNLSKIVMTLATAKKNLSQITLLGQALETSFNEIYLFDTKTLECIYANQYASRNSSDPGKPIDLNCTMADKFLSYSNEELLIILEPLFLKQKEFIVIESMTMRQDGTTYPAELRIQLSFAKNYPTMIVVANDITERKLAENKLLEMNSTLERKVEERTIDLEKSLGLINATLQSTTDAILVVNNQNKIIQSNSKLNDLFYDYDERNEVNYVDFIESKLVSPKIFEIRLSEISKFPQLKTCDLLTLKNGRIYECYSQPQIVNNNITGRVWCFRDVTTQKNLEQQLLRQATHDTLTDMPNRALLEDRINQSIKYCNAKKTIFAVLFIDLNRFKSVNDIFGLQIGDELLKQVAIRINQNLESNDTVARLGGDEFIILLNSLKSVDDITAYTQHLLNKISSDYDIQKKIIKISASIGITIYPKDANDVTTLLRNADIAMHRSKQGLGSTFNFFTNEMNDQAKKILEIENYLNTAIENDEIVLNYQPILNIQTLKIVGVEALIRWHHPTLGFVSPTEFIPVAEATGTILPIGEWVFYKACKQLKNWHDMGYTDIRIAINVSAHQFQQVNFISKIEKIIADTNVNPLFIDIELTESTMLENISSVSLKMEKLRSLGMTLVVDDFGTGYSSLNYLKNLPIGKIKIDRSFIQTLNNSSSEITIISAIIAMANSMHFKVLAEGIENHYQFSLLRDKGCQELQGYFLSQALDEKSCRDFFDSYSQGLINLNL